MIVEILKTLFERDLGKLQDEMELYENEENIWKIENQISNSAGNLCLHLIGNLSAFIGAELGKTGYLRNRESEFSLKNIPRIDLIQDIEKIKLVVSQTLDKLNTEDLEMDYPLIIFEKKHTTGFFLLHLSTHLSYHLGQINYHRRLLDHD